VKILEQIAKTDGIKNIRILGCETVKIGGQVSVLQKRLLYQTRRRDVSESLVLDTIAGTPQNDHKVEFYFYV